MDQRTRANIKLLNVSCYRQADRQRFHAILEETTSKPTQQCKTHRKNGSLPGAQAVITEDHHTFKNKK